MYVDTEVLRSVNKELVKKETSYVLIMLGLMTMKVS